MTKIIFLPILFAAVLLLPACREYKHVPTETELGYGLAIDEIDHRKMKYGQLYLEGVVINLQFKEAHVPNIMATVVDAANRPLEKVLVVPAERTIKGKGKITFSRLYRNPPGANNITYAFTSQQQKVIIEFPRQ